MAIAAAANRAAASYLGLVVSPWRSRCRVAAILPTVGEPSNNDHSP
jgi:hypothetical protein